MSDEARGEAPDPVRGGPTRSGPARGRSVSVDRDALRALRQEVLRSRETTAALQRQLAGEVEMARKAVEEAVKARKERGEYRRVLAAAIAFEKRALAEARASRQDAERMELDLRAAVLARGAAEGRARELEQQLEAVRAEGALALSDARDQAWSEGEDRRRELQRTIFERGVALGQVKELLRRVPREVPDSVRAAAWRARAGLGASGLLGVAFVLLLVDLLVWPQRERFLPLELEGLAHLFLLLTLVLTALGLGAWALGELRRAERGMIEAVAGVNGLGGGAVATETPETTETTETPDTPETTETGGVAYAGPPAPRSWAPDTPDPTESPGARVEVEEEAGSSA